MMSFMTDHDPTRSRKPLSFPIPAFVPTKSFAAAQNFLDRAGADEVSCQKSPAQAGQTPAITPASVEEKRMILTYKSLSKNGRNAFYTGALVALRIPLTAFPSRRPPATIEVAGEPFAPAKVAKVKMTAEERKAARAAAPKLTLAEKIARREAALAKLKAKAEADSAHASM